MHPLNRAELRRVLALPQYPRSSHYDPQWVIDNLMGPNVLWLTEALTDALHLTSRMRVLDLGCGKAISSIFLAHEFGVSVWATDLWIDAASNCKRVQEAGERGRVFPIHAEAHDLPFADGFFDAIVSLDAYHYFGTDDLYLEYLTRFARDGAEIGIAVPGTTRELDGPPSTSNRFGIATSPHSTALSGGATIGRSQVWSRSDRATKSPEGRNIGSCGATRASSRATAEHRTPPRCSVLIQGKLSAS